MWDWGAPDRSRATVSAPSVHQTVAGNRFAGLGCARRKQGNGPGADRAPDGSRE